MSDHFSLETATKASLTTLTQYIFRAMSEKGVGSVTSSRDAMLINMSKLMPASDGCSPRSRSFAAASASRHLRQH